MSDTALAVEVRERSGKGIARKLRAAGRVPAVLYGLGKQPMSLALDPKALEELLHEHGANALFDLAGEGIGGRTVIVKELQREPVRGALTHADLLEVDPNAKITVHVALHLVGSAVGVRLEGGLLDHALREIEVECLARSIPERIDVNVEELGLGDSIHVKDLVLPEGVELETSGELSVVSVVAPAVEEEPEVAEDAVEGEGVEGEAAEGDAAGEGDAGDKAAEGKGDKPAED